ASDSGTNASGVYKVNFPHIDDDPEVDRFIASPYYTSSYHFASTYTTNGDISFTVVDNVGNVYLVTLEVIKDTIAPQFTFVDILDPVYDPDENELDDQGNWYDQSELVTGFTINTDSYDPLNGLKLSSGIYTVNVSWTSTNPADNQVNDLGVDGDGVITGLVDDSDGNITVAIYSYDFVGNYVQTSITIRFDNTSPISIDYTKLHQNGAFINIIGSSSDPGSGIQNITLQDTSGNHFPSIITNGFSSWLVTNTSSLDVDVSPNENITIIIDVFDNVNNKHHYNVTINYHTLRFFYFAHTIPEKVEIDHPGDWNITVGLEYDGTLVGESDRVASYLVNVSQFSAWINGTDLAIVTPLHWLPGPYLSFTVSLPGSFNSSETIEHLTIGDSYFKHLRVLWRLESSSVILYVDHTSYNVVTYHDLDVVYIGHDLIQNITETDNPAILNVTLYLRKDGSSMEPSTGSVSGQNMIFYVDGLLNQSATVVGSVQYIGSGQYLFPIQLPSGLRTGWKHLTFTWLYGTSGQWSEVYEYNSSNNVLRYHNISITASLPSEMQLFEIDGDFYFNISFSMFEDNGTGVSPVVIDSLTNDSIIELSIRNTDLLSQVGELIHLGNGNYYFTFTLFDNNTDQAWIGSQDIVFRLVSPLSFLSDQYLIRITGHDLQMSISSIVVPPAGLNIFDPDERTAFDMTVVVQDNNGTGSVYLSDLQNNSFIEIYMENVNDPNQNATIVSFESWEALGSGTYKINFVLEAIKAGQLGLGDIRLIFTIKDTNGHNVISSLIDLVSKDFVTLLGLEWIQTSFGFYSFDDSNATLKYTFRMSVNDNITLYFKIYALEDPDRKPIADNTTIYWKTPWNATSPIKSTVAQGYIAINLSSSIPYHQAFIAYAEGNEEKQTQLIRPWIIYLEWEKISYSAEETDDSESDSENHVLNVDGTFSLTYFPKFVVSDYNVKGATIKINLTIESLLDMEWTAITGNLNEYLDESTKVSYPITNGIVFINHYDGKGSRLFSITRSSEVIGYLILEDNEDKYSDADGKINIRIWFNDIYRVNLTVYCTTETETSSRYYSSYFDYQWPMYSYVDDVNESVYHSTLIWTKFVSRIWASDSDGRLPLQTGANIFVEAFYAHNYSLGLDGVRVYLLDNDTNTEIPNLQWDGHQTEFNDLVSSGSIQLVKFNVSRFEDNVYGIKTFDD
ncbi:MAG: hypothetical protein ACTSPV_17370, partial [Candidatus Hodarchaeales archaeon]